MPRTKNGYIGGLEPLQFAVNHLQNVVVFSLQNKTGARVAIELNREQAQILSLVGRQDDERPKVLDAEFEVYGGLYVSDSPLEASCDSTLERWEGPKIPIRIQFQEEPRRLIWSVRDPEHQIGFVCKLTESARGALFTSIISDNNAKIVGRCSLEGDLEVVQ